MLRNIVYVLLIIFFIIASVAAFFVISTVNKADDAVVQPIGDLVRRLVLPATPVILPNPSTILRNMEDEARLITVSSEFEKVVTAERNQDVLWGALGETMVFVANGTVVAGIDLRDMTPEDIQVWGPDKVVVHVPEAQIFDDLPVLDNDKSHVVDRDTGLLTRADPDLETEVRQIAEQQLLEEAQGSELLTIANENAKKEIMRLLVGIGFPEEGIEFVDETPPTAPPFEQVVPKGFVITPAP